LRIAKIDVDFGRQRKATMIRKFLSPVPGQRDLYNSFGSFFSADSAGEPFDAAKNYRLNVPKNVPAQDFCSVVL
jgi:hypothetical protein